MPHAMKTPFTDLIRAKLDEHGIREKRKNRSTVEGRAEFAKARRAYRRAVRAALRAQFSTGGE